MSEATAKTVPAEESNKNLVPIKEWGVARFLFNDKRSAPIWLVIRVWLGVQWFFAGWEKAMFWDFNKGSWLHNGGAGLKGYWERAIATAPGAKGAAITYDWYYSFLKGLDQGGHYEWFAWVITFGEMAVGLGLIFGCLTGFAALFGALMNFSFELAGSSSTNPMLFLVAVLLIMGWRASGWWGLDRYVLPILGTPWQPGKIFNRRPTSKSGGVKPGIPQY